jgi:hypothetical protein
MQVKDKSKWIASNLRETQLFQLQTPDEWMLYTIYHTICFKCTHALAIYCVGAAQQVANWQCKNQFVCSSVPCFAKALYWYCWTHSSTHNHKAYKKKAKLLLSGYVWYHMPLSSLNYSIYPSSRLTLSTYLGKFNATIATPSYSLLQTSSFTFLELRWVLILCLQRN